MSPWVEAPVRNIASMTDARVVWYGIFTCTINDWIELEA
jgi:hypothetical protein